MNTCDCKNIPLVRFDYGGDGVVFIICRISSEAEHIALNDGVEMAEFSCGTGFIIFNKIVSVYLYD